MKAAEETKMNAKMNFKRSQWGDLAQDLHVVVVKKMMKGRGRDARR
jgi:hypothetical protein